jgi:ATP-dependent Clp protease ATP-binding subunit ClpC
MFERYTESARRALFFARYESSQLGSISIEPEHLLLGLLRDSRAVSTLTQVSVEELRKDIEKSVVFTEKISTSVEIPFSEAAKHVLQFAAQEADALRHKHIGTEHLLLGLLREEHSAAASALAARGVRLSDVRHKVEKLPGPLEASPEAGIQIEMTIDGIKSLVAELARAPRDSREASELVARIHALLDALLNDSGLR